MDLFIFDMDGVLLKPHGYHRALKETVRQAGISTGFGEVVLSDTQIAQFEAVGVSSEWHSSALCMAVMVLEKQKGFDRKNNQSQPVVLDLKNLLAAIDVRPKHEPTISRGLEAIEELAAISRVPPDHACLLVAQSESIQYSPTMKWFQELVLGSVSYTSTYQMDPQFETESYLELYDEPLLFKSQTEWILQWIEKPDHGAAIMTRRPSRGALEFADAPDADIGAALVGLERLPRVGYGELHWMAAQTGREVGDLSKPAWEHALIAILAASGWPLEKALTYAGKPMVEWELLDLLDLDKSTFTVFEDTPGGMISVQKAGDLLNDMGLSVNVRKFGIAKELSKQSALSAQGAIVFPDINQALLNIAHS
jgi:phosphoglycolate phosphatase-like HAD superfamily hydrolase